MEKKIIEIYKHPYMWKVEVNFGSFEQMIDNRCGWQRWHGYQVFIGGSFNERMNKTSRAALVQLGVEFSAKECTYKEKLEFWGVSSAKGIRYSNWEGTYCYIESMFDDMIKNGLYPVQADWNGVTYIERGYFDKNRNWKTYYERTDTYRY